MTNSKCLLTDYYGKEHNNIIELSLQNTQTKCLEELAEIIPGKRARSYDYRETGISYLRARDIQEGVITTSVYLEPAITVEFSRQLIQEGDILLSKHLGLRKLALVSRDNLPAIASESLYILRPFDVSERYLYQYLTSKTGNAVFSAQLKKIEKGAVIASIALSDLKKIQVPVYDEDIMMDYEHMDALNEEDRFAAALRIIHADRNRPESKVEEFVYNELVAAGWKAKKFCCQDAITIEGGKRWIPDFSYSLQDKTKVYFEVKDALYRESSEWALAIKKILKGQTKCYYILTTGYYYEVHVTGSEKSLKILHAPTLQEIIDWERGQN